MTAHPRPTPKASTITAKDRLALARDAVGMGCSVSITPDGHLTITPAGSPPPDPFDSVDFKA